MLFAYFYDVLCCLFYNCFIVIVKQMLENSLHFHIRECSLNRVGDMSNAYG